MFQIVFTTTDGKRLRARTTFATAQDAHDSIARQADDRYDPDYEADENAAYRATLTVEHTAA